MWGTRHIHLDSLTKFASLEGRAPDEPSALLFVFIHLVIVIVTIVVLVNIKVTIRITVVRGSCCLFGRIAGIGTLVPFRWLLLLRFSSPF